MKKLISGIFLLVAAAILASGCSAMATIATDSLWVQKDGKKLVYISYWEGTEANYIVWRTLDEKSRVKRCEVQADNRLKCFDEDYLEKVLNAE